MLPTSRALYQIWHRPTESEIGFVLALPDGQWLTALWSPHRLGDFSLPLSSSANDSANRETVSSPADERSTELTLSFVFPAAVQSVRFGLQPGLTLQHLTNAHLEVSAERNLFLRTAPCRFEIQDCEWRPIEETDRTNAKASEELGLVKRQEEGGGRKRTVRKEGDAPLGKQSGGARSPSLLRTVGPDRQASRQSARPARRLDSSRAALPRPATAIRGSNTESERGIASGAVGKPAPSPVVLQLNWEPPAVTIHKPSQTYRYNPRLPLLAWLDIYNFSDVAQLGDVRSELPTEWAIQCSQSGDGLCASGKPASPKRELRTRVSVPSFGRVRLALRFYPEAGGRRGDPVLSRESSIQHPGASGEAQLPMRRMVNLRWQGENGLADRCAAWIEAEPVGLAPNVTLPLRDWKPTPEQPQQWGISFPHSDSIRLRLLDPPSPGSMASAILPFPAIVALREEDLLCLELRLIPPRPHTTYRVNLITSEREVFRYTEDQWFGNYWTKVAWRIGDLGPTFWSRYGPDYRLPVSRLRHLRLSFGNLEAGDQVEIRNVGLVRPRSPSAAKAYRKMR